MASYWCYRCTRFVRVSSDHIVACPYCDGGFIEAVDSTPPPLDSPRPLSSSAGRTSNPRFRRGRPNHVIERSVFNPVIVLRGAADVAGEDGGGERSFDLYYDDGAGSGLRPLPAAVSEFLMSSGFDRLLQQLAQINLNGFIRQEQPPASKSAIEAMSKIEIGAGHVNSELHCAVCKEAFTLRSEAREMPCNHIYHSDCILPWLSIRNSCPVCRHELPSETASSVSADGFAGGLTIWRLPGGGFAVGRFSGGRRSGERELPAVYTEMDGGFSNNGVPRRVAWASGRETSRRRSGFGRVFRNFVSLFRSSNANANANPNPNSSPLHSSSSSESSQSMAASISRSQSGSVLSRNSSSRSRTFANLG